MDEVVPSWMLFILWIIRWPHQSSDWTADHFQPDSRGATRRHQRASEGCLCVCLIECTACICMCVLACVCGWVRFHEWQGASFFCSPGKGNVLDQEHHFGMPSMWWVSIQPYKSKISKPHCSLICFCLHACVCMCLWVCVCVYVRACVSVCVSAGFHEPRSRCSPSPCYKSVGCMETFESPGYRCGPCPEGMMGNGTHCQDIDEV